MYTFMHRSDMVRLVFFGVAFFTLGFLSFGVYSIRIGPHSQSVRDLGAKVSIARVMDICNLKEHRALVVHCLGREITKIIPRWGLEALVKATTERRMTSPHDDLSVTRCHDITHQLGKNSVLLGLSMKEILTSCTELCQSGCFHGAAVGWAMKGESIGKNFTSICLLPGIPEDKKDSCIHGMGHAVTPMGLYDTKRSLSYCDIYTGDDRPNCGSGVFMEMYDGTEYSDGKLRALPEDRPAWCGQFDPPYDEVCYSQSGYFENNRGHDLEAAIAICHKVPNDYQFDCLTFLGKTLYFVYPLTSEQIQATETYCHRVLPDQYDACVSVVETDFIH